jgi:hypothetical protein
MGYKNIREMGGGGGAGIVSTIRAGSRRMAMWRSLGREDEWQDY